MGASWCNEYLGECYTDRGGALSSSHLINPQSYKEVCKQTCPIFVLEGDNIFIILDSNLLIFPPKETLIATQTSYKKSSRIKVDTKYADMKKTRGELYTCVCVCVCEFSSNYFILFNVQCSNPHGF